MMKMNYEMFRGGFEDFYKTHTEVTANFFERLCMNEKGGNVLMSPLCLMSSLGMLAEATSGETNAEMMEVICPHGNKSVFDRSISKAIKLANDSESIAIRNAVVASKVLSRSINRRYKSIIKRKYYGMVFSSEDPAADANDWVNKNSKGMLPRILESGLEEGVEMAFLSAAAFDSEWETPYKKAQIQDMYFHNIDGTIIRVPSLYSAEGIYLEDEIYMGFAKLYANSEYAYVALLPKDNNGTHGEKLNIRKLLEHADNATVKVTMPEFKVEREFSVKSILMEMGINRIFSKSAEMTSMTSENVMLGDVRQKAFIEVDRHGTRAATAMVFCGKYGGLVKQKIHYITLDRPFIFAVVNMTTGLPVFLGKVNKLQ